MKTALHAFKTGNFTENALSFFEMLGYNTEYSQPLSQKTYAGFANELKPLNETNARVSEWHYVDQLFFLTPENTTLAALQVDDVIIEAYLIFGIELKKPHYSRGDLVKITREINTTFLRPVLVLFKHGDTLTLSVIHRRVNKNDASKDVIEIKKVSMLKDIRLENPHRAHLDILESLAFSNLKPKPTNFVELHNAWQKVLNTKELNKQFYEKLFDWYLFALSEVKFPQIRAEADLVADEQHQSESLIRLLTRLLFVWFMKEKGLINPELFEPKNLKSILKNFTGENSNDTIFYKAILQNLFFATLNMPIEQRKVIYNGFAPSDYGNQLVYRYAELFNDADFKIHFDDIPFLNGGLFDCLDQRKTDLSPEIRLDGFSTQAKKQAVAPDKLFFGEYKNVDLSTAYDNKKKSNVTVYGLIDILQNHKFTVEENTPLEEDIALDPELLGQVFENLLAAYNPETGTTARKQTGSFYTPREIVDYMVDESLLAYFESTLNVNSTLNVGAALAALLELQMRLKPHLQLLLNYDNTQNPFDAPQTDALISAIDNLKILDPACGSGAFPMGILHKLVFVLSKLDPKNEKWRDRQIAKLKVFDDSALREKFAANINAAFENNELDYGRKLFLIENCIHGVDIQPIATQISKLRFFISLIVDQKSNGDKASNFGIRPLPNLDFKIIAANTLIAAPQDDFENNALFSNDDFFTKFSDLTHDYFNVATPDEKCKCRDKIESLINTKCDEKIKAIDSLSHNEAKYKKQIDQLESHKKLWQSYANLFKHEAVAFFEPRYFFPQLSGGFDIVIGNPPYVRADNPAIAKQRLLITQSKQYETLWEKWDLMIPFYEKTLKTLKANGVHTFVVSNSITTSKYAQLLQDWILKNYQVKSIDYFNDIKTFDAGVIPVITIIQNTKSLTKTVKKFRKDSFENVSTIEIDLKTTLENLKIKIFKQSFSDMFNPDIEKELLGDIFYMSKGMVTNADEQEAKGEFVKNDLISNTRTELHSKPYIEGKNLKAYSIEKIRYIEWNSPRVPEGLSRATFRALYDGEKILRGRVTKGIIDDAGIVCNDSIIVMKRFVDLKGLEERSITTSIAKNNLSDDDKKASSNKKAIVNKKRQELEKISLAYSLKFILAIINSKYAMAFLNNFRRHRLENYFYPDDFRNLPIPKIPAAEQQPFIQLVDKILADKKAGNDTSALEREIDVLVYGLYGLSDEEILIVEGGGGK